MILLLAVTQSPITGDRLALVAVALLSLIGVAFQARSMRRASDKKVDAEAYQRARDIDEGVLASLKEEIVRLREQIAALRAELKAEEEAHDATKVVNQELRDRLHEVEQTVQRMSRLLASAGLELPPSLDPRRGGSFGGDEPTHQGN